MWKPVGSCPTGRALPILYRRAAYFVDKILKGAKPADLPVEQPTKFELDHQSEDRQADRPDDPADVLARADKMIK